MGEIREMLWVAVGTLLGQWWFWVGGIGALAVMVLGAKSAGKRTARRDALKWTEGLQARELLLTPAEWRMEQAIRRALDRCGKSDWRVYGQVAASALFERARRQGGGRWLVPPWCLDFVVVDAKGRIRGVLELNDRSHDARNRQIRDGKIRAGFAKLGVPIVFVRGRGAEEAMEGWVRGLGLQAEHGR